MTAARSRERLWLMWTPGFRVLFDVAGDGGEPFRKKAAATSHGHSAYPHPRRQGTRRRMRCVASRHRNQEQFNGRLLFLGTHKENRARHNGGSILFHAWFLKRDIRGRPSTDPSLYAGLGAVHSWKAQSLRRNSEEKTPRSCPSFQWNLMAYLPTPSAEVGLTIGEPFGTGRAGKDLAAPLARGRTSVAPRCTSRRGRRLAGT